MDNIKLPSSQEVKWASWALEAAIKGLPEDVLDKHSQRLSDGLHRRTSHSSVLNNGGKK